MELQKTTDGELYEDEPSADSSEWTDDDGEEREAEATGLMNEIANASVRCWLTTLGLATSAREIAGTSVSTVALDAMLERATALIESIVQAGEHAMDTPIRAEELVEDANRSRHDLARLCREIAQLSLGITSLAEWTPTSAVLERSAVIAVTQSEFAVPDEVCTVMRSTDADDLIVELAGFVCRLLLSSHREIWIEPATGPTIFISGGSVGPLRVTCDDEIVEWQQPVTVLEPARHLVELITQRA